MLIEGDVVRIGEKADANGVTIVNQHAIKMKSDVQEVAIIFFYIKSAFANQTTHCRHRYLLQDSTLSMYLSIQRALLFIVLSSIYAHPESLLLFIVE